MQDAAYGFVNALRETVKLDGERHSAKIIIYGRQRICDTITFRHNEELIDGWEFLARKNDDDGKMEFIAVLKEDPGTVFNCRLLSYDTEDELFMFLLKPEFTRVDNNQPDEISLDDDDELQ